jgi:hypothetical protein
LFSSQWQLRAAKTYRAIPRFSSRATPSMWRSRVRNVSLIWFVPRAFLRPAAISIEEMELVNALCRLAEYAEREAVLVRYIYILNCSD